MKHRNPPLQAPLGRDAKRAYRHNLFVYLVAALAALGTAIARGDSLPRTHQDLLLRWQRSEQPTFCPGESPDESEMELFKQAVVARGFSTVDFRARPRDCTVVLCSDATIPLRVIPDERAYRARYIASRQGKLSCFRDR